MNLQLKELKRNELLDFWNLAFSKPDAEWTKWNGPYFHDKLPEKQKFIDLDLENSYVQNPMRKIIWVDNTMVGMVSAQYEDEPLKQWLDVGIVIYKQDNWHHGIGKTALKQWINELFEMTPLPHIGLTTWSGNHRMIALAESLSLKKEAEVRQVRFWQNKYWDSVKYGVLRSEWMQ
ncbi:GNAT family N-acetyltransferase [Weissella paramesenteroides]|uniref:GNAT family N-acetyltransferase n=1 Tax=Weissella paramesenteroides TaxID=1249 RepID=UPI001238AE2B|nr:GNAT family protein [Weissella paramesenteroides]KAA8438751.1 GNAT family N-acetyltransferase [Weissella paramesenteroides]KAA8440777.1 GNAT family N-acetyltransferase [Weissella paramesenteroides]KAA8443208.1 GNAT family N-acetyltransferase [Weissella paramesenteroides]KAA8445394.1 GNAT family N-acetyltransferase [Weissella paramesenteroides]KAA8448815.1 GNAT family N-acetyltransferase [Weissella paramesenteroides]